MTMSFEQLISKCGDKRLGLDGKLAAYLAAAGAVGSVLASEARSSDCLQQHRSAVRHQRRSQHRLQQRRADRLQIDHDRVNLSGTDLDYLQIDKNDASSAAESAADPDISSAHFRPGSTAANEPRVNAQVCDVRSGTRSLSVGADAGHADRPGLVLDFQEGDNFRRSVASIIRVNRLIDEDAGQIDTAAGGCLAYSPLPGSPNFVGLGGAVRYLGVQSKSEQRWC